MSSRAMKLAVLNTAHLHWTKNDLASGVRQSSAEIMNALLVESIDVALSARHAHWNVRGPHFAALHDLFGSVFDELNTHIDTLGQRIAALGVIARGTAQDVVSESTLKPYPMFSLSETEHIEALATRLGLLGNELRSGIDECQRNGDPVSADILTQVCKAVDQLLWRVEGHQIRLQS